MQFKKVMVIIVITLGVVVPIATFMLYKCSAPKCTIDVMDLESESIVTKDACKERPGAWPTTYNSVNQYDVDPFGSSIL